MVRQQKKKDKEAELLYEKLSDEANRVLLRFILPVLRDLRRITKLFQLKTGDNLKVFMEVKNFFLVLGSRILRKSTMDNNSARQLCEIDLGIGRPGKPAPKNQPFPNVCFMSIDGTKYGQVFLDGIKQFTPNTQKLLKEQATNFLRRLFVGFQDRLGSQKGNTFKIIEDIEPFALPGFKNNPPKGTDFKKPFFDAGKLIFI